MEGEGGRKAYIGMGFEERGDAYVPFPNPLRPSISSLTYSRLQIRLQRRPSNNLQTYHRGLGAYAGKGRAQGLLGEGWSDV